MLINEMMYKRFKSEIEDSLEKYPYYVMSIETPGLGSVTRWEEVRSKSNTHGDPVGRTAIDDEYKRILVNAVEYIYDKLDDKSKTIIKYYYFEGNVIKPQEVMEELLITKNRYYELKKIALYKFMLGLGCC